MGLVIRLRRHGSRKRPFYRIVVADSKSPRDGRFVDQIGTYDPITNPPKVTLQADKAERWRKAGALPSDTVKKLIEDATVTAQSA
ncbi:MAG TPA: 30S ribosomal protein S16 [Candidatus Binataceae bacterium]|nr:30S ribosomal protein S16 [Candidatus Binataceae bacterium]